MDLWPAGRARGDNITEAEALIFTQGVSYDIIVVADEAGDFGDYISYRTWDPKLVVGTQGLVATTWRPAQYRLGRGAIAEPLPAIWRNALMRPIDYQGWMAMRAIGEAAWSMTIRPIRRAFRVFLDGPDFNLANYKGLGGSFRPWDQQLRQALLLAQPKSVIAVAPQPGFLHQRTPLDTLGVDEPETNAI